MTGVKVSRAFNIPLTVNAESAFFFNGALKLATAPAVHVSDQLAQRPTRLMNCTKKP
jgi:hypothetical protein